MPQKSGIYQIEAADGTWYVGQAVNFRTRSFGPKHGAYEILGRPDTKVTLYEVDLSHIDYSAYKNQGYSQARVNRRTLGVHEQNIINQMENRLPGQSLNIDPALNPQNLSAYRQEFPSTLGAPTVINVPNLPVP